MNRSYRRRLSLAEEALNPVFRAPETVPAVCRWCYGAVPRGRRTYCSPECVHEWRLRSSVSYLRECIFRRDRGVCSACQRDTEKDRRYLTELGSLDPALQLDVASDMAVAHRIGPKGQVYSLWDADHRLAVADGGGMAGEQDISTLCLGCHRKKTVIENKIRRKARKKK